MPRLSRVPWLVAALAATLAPACALTRVGSATRPGTATVVLLPDGEDGHVGRARVSNEAGAVNLEAERDATRVRGDRAPSLTATMSQADVERIFGDALSALPDPPRRFTLYFQFGSDDLTEQAGTLVPEILRAVTARSVPDVVVVGHTDTAGTRGSNFDLAMKRANFVRSLLVAAGLDASAIELISHGETDLALPTPDDTPEPRNRRVEIAVR